MKSKLVTFLGLVALTLVGCGGTKTEAPDTGKETEAPKTDVTPAQKDELVIGSPTAHQEFVKGEVEKFLKAEGLDSKYTVKMYELGEAEANGVADWTAAAAPDIYAFASDQIGALNNKGALAEVPEAFATKMVEDMGELAAGAGVLGDSTYAYPYAGDNGYFLYYNKSLVAQDKIGNVNDLIAACAEKGTKFAYALDTDSSFFSIGTFMTFGARYTVNLNTDGSFLSATSTFNTEAGIKGGKAVKSLLANTNVITAHGSARDVVPNAANGIGAIVEGSWKYNAYKEALGENLGLAALPTITIDGETKNFASFLGYKLYGVNPKKSGGNAERLTVLHKIANYLVSATAQEARFDALNVVPTNASVKKLQKVQNNELVAALAAQSAYSVPQTVVPGNVWSGAEAAVDSLKAADSDVAQVMATYASTIASSTGY